MKKIVKIAFIAVAMAVAGLGVYTSQGEEIGMSDLMLANVEALADEESDREDCMIADGLCSELVIYDDGDYGEDILLGHTKKPGWL